MSTREHDTRQNTAKKQPPAKLAGYPDYVCASTDNERDDNTKGSKSVAKSLEDDSNTKGSRENRDVDKGKASVTVPRKTHVPSSKKKMVSKTTEAAGSKTKTKIETLAPTKISEARLPKTKALEKGKSEPANESENQKGKTPSNNMSTATTKPIQIPEAMAKLWVQPVEPAKGKEVDKRVIGVRHKESNSTRFYLLEDLKWYHLKRVPEARKEAWRFGTLKVAMTREAVDIKAFGLKDAYGQWGCFAVMAGHSAVDPLHADELAWGNSIYLNVYHKPIGEQAIRDHRNNMKATLKAGPKGGTEKEGEVDGEEQVAEDKSEGDAGGDGEGGGEETDGEESDEEGEEADSSVSDVD